MGSNYEAFDSVRPCPKCLGRDIATAYQILGDVLRRTCRRCGFWWNERPIDRAEYNPEAKTNDRP